MYLKKEIQRRSRK